MTWPVFLAALAVLALLGRTRLGVRGRYAREELGLWLRLGGAEIRLYPVKKKDKPPKEKKKKADKPPKGDKPGEKKPPFLSPGGMFRLARGLLPVVLEGANAFRRRLQVDVLHAEILVGAPDPADAAQRYGQLNALLGAVWQPLTQALHVQDGRVHVGIDFDRTEPALYASVSLSITASQLLWLGLRYGPVCLKIFLDVRKQEKAAQKQRRKAA